MNYLFHSSITMPAYLSVLKLHGQWRENAAEMLPSLPLPPTTP